MKYVFGPVPSRRMGNSLGVDLVPYKTCTQDCVYCQLGATTDQTTQRRSFVPVGEVIAEVEEALASDLAIDYITLSGSGEPTLSLDCGRVVGAIRERTALPVAVLTNGSLLDRSAVRDDLARADVVVPSFDAATQEVFERLNRPGGLRARDIAQGIRDFSRGYRGRLWLEVMVVEGINDTVEEAQAIVAALEGSRVDRVDLNAPVRAPAEHWVRAPRRERLEALAAVLRAIAPVEIVRQYHHRGRESRHEELETDILAALQRRPCSARELSVSLGASPALVAKYVDHMARAGAIEAVAAGGQVQYRAVRS